MAFKHSSGNNANSPGIASDQGVAHWPAFETIDIKAVTDYVAVQPAWGIEIFALANDIGEGLFITSVSVRDPIDGKVSTDGKTIMYLTDERFHYLGCGEHTEITLDYSIADSVGRTDEGVILVTIERPPNFWEDEDGLPIEDEDDAFITFCYDTLKLWWIDEDDAVLDDESGSHVLTLET